MPVKPAGLDDGQDIDVEALRAEVTKWQERVPKLAKALRERTDELAVVREQLREAQSTSSAGSEDSPSNDARLAARNQLIEELQQKVNELGDKHRKAAGELHTTQLDLESVRDEAASWQAKWQDVTAALDDSVAVAANSKNEFEQAKSAWQTEQTELLHSHSAELEKFQRDNESLRVRNANLGETIEFANKQIASLGEDMALLVEQGKTAADELNGARAECAALREQHAQQQGQISSLESHLADRQGGLDDAQAQLQAASSELADAQSHVTQLRQELESANDAATQSVAAQQARFEQQIRELEAKLEVEDERYSKAMQAADEEQTQLAKLLDDKDTKLKALKADLDQAVHARDALQQEYAQAQKSFSEAHAQIEQGMALAQDKQKQIEALTSQIQKIEQRAGAAEQQVSDLKSQLSSNKAEQEELQVALDTALAKYADAQALENTEARKAQEQLASVQQELDNLRGEHEAHLVLQVQKLEEINTLRAEQQRWNDVEQDLLQQVNAVTVAGEEKQKELDTEIQRLNDCVEQAQESHAQRESERRELADKLKVFEEENGKLKSNLAERSALVRELEDERQRNMSSQSSAESKFAEVSQQLTEARHKLTTFQEHAEKLEGKLVTQQGLMSELEEELSEAQETQANAAKAAEQRNRAAKEERAKLAEQLTQAEHRCDDLNQANDKLQQQYGEHAKQLAAVEADVERERSARQDQQNAVHALQAELENAVIEHRQEIAVLQSQQDSDNPAPAAGSSQQMRELEQLLRERTQELDKLRWRLEQQPPQTDDNVVLILNQQLDDARAENQRLREKLAGARVEKEDDLTQLKGIGEKLAEQLNDLGVNTFAQISALDKSAIEAEDHPLHSFRTRILRDNWIKQAKALLQKA